MTDAPVIYATVHVAASATLDQLNTVLADNEGNIGPLVGMRIDNDTTLLKFEATDEPPAPIAKIAPQTGGAPAIPDGAVLVASGQVYIVGVITLCAATRG